MAELIMSLVSFYILIFPTSLTYIILTIWMMHLIGVSISCETQDDIYLNNLLSADNLAFSAMLVMSRHVNTQHYLLLNIKFCIPSRSLIFLLYSSFVLTLIYAIHSFCEFITLALLKISANEAKHLVGVSLSTESEKEMDYYISDFSCCF